ncbi:BRCA1-A complex subunit RAP80 isoform X2 [Hemicordylus capensis]|nr:BRCA1-A complex subunit RAP80 isoform X2 [Hemicordylus capensis]
MPKKKRKTADGPDSQTQDRKEEESRGLSNTKLKRSFMDACIVISDSDGEQESKEEHCLQKKRTKQQLDRTKFAAKRKITQMTEDEQFALALQMSEQEARHLNSQEEEEEELLRKAIAESLGSCQPSGSSAAAAMPLVAQAPASPVESHAAEQEASELLAAPLPCSESPCSECSSLSLRNEADENGQTDVAKRPLVVLTRLSQEIVESSLVSSIIVSPGKSPTLARSNENPSSPAGSDSSDTPPSLEEENPITLSPTFPQRPLGAWPLAPHRLFARECGQQKPTGKNIDQLPPNYSEADPPEGCSKTHKKVPQQHSVLDHSSNPGAELGQQLEHGKEPVQRPGMLENTPPLCTLPMADECKQEEDHGTVHYYWGVPFCPKGVDPNKYTQVILCQLEVYQKSLKQAQRQLLQKKRFGEPVVPALCTLRRSERGKGEEAFRGCDDADEQEGGDADEKKEPESVAWLLAPTNKEPHKNPEQNMAEGGNSDHEDEPASSSCQASQVLFAEDALEEGEPMQITQSISALTPLDSKRSPDIAAENNAEEEVTICPETQPSPSQAIEPESGEIHSSSKDVSLQADEDTRENVSARSPPADDPMSCPLCDRRFPVSEIELHAMYCNGTGEDAFEDMPAILLGTIHASPGFAESLAPSRIVSLVLEKTGLLKSTSSILMWVKFSISALGCEGESMMTRRQREAKSKATGGKEMTESVDIDKYEKCYVCKSQVPRKEYRRHVDNCLWIQAANGTPGGRRLRCAKEEGGSEGRLLSMLEQSERKAADAKVTTTPSRGEGSRDSSPEADKEVECHQDVWGACSDSPIKSFTSISEAKVCLVDFKKQSVIGSGSQHQTKANFRSKKKF